MTVHTRRARPDSSRLELTRPSHHSQHERPGGAPGGGGQNPGGGGGSLRRTLALPRIFPRLRAHAGATRRAPHGQGSFRSLPARHRGRAEARAFTRDLRLEIEGMARANIEMAEEAATSGRRSAYSRVDMKPAQGEYEWSRRAPTRSWGDTTPGPLETMKNRGGDRLGERRGERGAGRKMSAEESGDIETAGVVPRRRRQGVHVEPNRRGKRNAYSHFAAAADARVRTPGGTERWDASNPKSWARVLEKKHSAFVLTHVRTP